MLWAFGLNLMVLRGGVVSKQPTEVVVERGPVLGADVKDANGVKAVQKEGTNTYVFPDTPKYPISSIGGFVDLDGDKKLSASDLSLKGKKLESYTKVVTPITTYLAKYPKKEERAKKEKELKKDLGIDEDVSLSNEVPSKISKEAVALTNALFELSLENKDMNKANIKAEYDSEMTTINQSYSEEKNLSKLSENLEKNLLNTKPELKPSDKEIFKNSISGKEITTKYNSPKHKNKVDIFQYKKDGTFIALLGDENELVNGTWELDKDTPRKVILSFEEKGKKEKHYVIYDNDVKVGVSSMGDGHLSQTVTAVTDIKSDLKAKLKKPNSSSTDDNSTDLSSFKLDNNWLNGKTFYTVDVEQKSGGVFENMLFTDTFTTNEIKRTDGVRGETETYKIISDTEFEVTYPKGDTDYFKLVKNEDGEVVFKYSMRNKNNFVNTRYLFTSKSAAQAKKEELDNL